MRTRCGLSLNCRGEARHEVWRVAPVGEYGHRLALDIHPVGGPDPLLALILELEEKERIAPDAEDFIVVLDPGTAARIPARSAPPEVWRRTWF